MKSNSNNMIKVFSEFRKEITRSIENKSIVLLKKLK